MKTKLGSDPCLAPRLLDPATVLENIFPGLEDIGCAARLKHDFLNVFPFTEPTHYPPGTALLLQPYLGAYGRPTAGTMDLGGGVKGVVDSLIIVNLPSHDANESTRHFVTAVRQRRAAGSTTAAPNNSFIVFNDAKVNEPRTLEDIFQIMGEESLAVVILFRVTKSSNETLAPSPPGKRQSNALKIPTAPPITPQEQRNKRASVDEMTELFRLRHNLFPLVVQLQGRDLKLLTIYRTPTHAHLTELGKCPQVRKRHLNELLDLQSNLSEDLLDLPLGEALVHHYQRKAQARNLKWQSLHRYMCNAHGAFADLPIYSNAPIPIPLALHVGWKSALRYVNTQMQANQPDDLPAATYTEVLAAVEACKDDQIAMAIMLAWMCAGRVGDVTQLKKGEILFQQVEETSIHRINFPVTPVIVKVRSGKTVELAQPFTVHTLCPPVRRARILAYMATIASDDDLLFNRSDVKSQLKLSTAITKALRVPNPKLSQRALRRGALQTLAADPDVSLETLRTFSGHTGNPMALRYLGWSRYSGVQKKLGEQAAMNLFRTGNRTETASSSTSTTSPRSSSCSSQASL